MGEKRQDGLKLHFDRRLCPEATPSSWPVMRTLTTPSEWPSIGGQAQDPAMRADQRRQGWGVLWVPAL